MLLAAQESKAEAYGALPEETAEPLSSSEDVQSLQLLVRLLVCGLLFVDYSLMTMVYPILPHALQNSGTGRDVADWAVFLLIASKAITQLLANQFVGKWVDRVGSYTPLLLAIYGLASTTLLFAFGLVLCEIESVPTWACYTVLIVARTSQGIPSAIVMSAGMSLIMSTHGEQQGTDAAGFVMSGLAAGVTLGPLIGGGFTAILPDWSSMLIVQTPMLVFMAVKIRSLSGADCMQQHAELELDVMGEALEAADTEHSLSKDPMVLLTACSLLLANTSIGLAEVVVPWVLKDSPFNYSPFYQGLIYLAPSLSYLAFTPTSAWLCGHFQAPIVMMVGMALAGAGLATLFAQNGELWCIIVGFSLIGSSVAMVDTPSMPQLRMIAERRNCKDLGSLYAIQDGATCAGFVLGPAIGAIIKASTNASYQWVTTPLGIFVMASAPALLLLPRGPMEGTRRESVMKADVSISCYWHDIDAATLAKDDAYGYAVVN